MKRREFFAATFGAVAVAIAAANVSHNYLTYDKRDKVEVLNCHTDNVLTDISMSYKPSSYFIGDKIFSRIQS